MSKILSKIGKKKKELLERKIGGKKSKIGSGLPVDSSATVKSTRRQFNQSEVNK